MSNTFSRTHIGQAEVLGFIVVHPYDPNKFMIRTEVNGACLELKILLTEEEIADLHDGDMFIGQIDYGSMKYPGLKLVNYRKLHDRVSIVGTSRRKKKETSNSAKHPRGDVDSFLSRHKRIIWEDGVDASMPEFHERIELCLKQYNLKNGTDFKMSKHYSKWYKPFAKTTEA